METKSLRLLVDVARRGSFAAAARAHDLDPSSVSRIVAQAEREIGARLFQRTTRRLSLTEAGGAYLGRVEPLLDELDKAEDEVRAVRAGPTGTLRMTASVAFGQRCIVPLLPRFAQDFAGLGLDLQLTDANLDLVAERIDLGIRLGPGVGGNLVRAKLMDTRYRVCASPAYLAAAPDLTRPEDLGGHDCLLFALPDYRTRWRFRGGDGRVAEVPVNGRIVMSNALALRDAAIAGLGPALLADWLVDEDIAERRLVDLFPDCRATATSFETAAWLVYPSRAFLPMKVRAAIDFLRRHVGRG